MHHQVDRITGGIGQHEPSAFSNDPHGHRMASGTGWSKHREKAFDRRKDRDMVRYPWSSELRGHFHKMDGLYVTSQYDQKIMNWKLLGTEN